MPKTIKVQEKYIVGDVSWNDSLYRGSAIWNSVSLLKKNLKNYFNNQLKFEKKYKKT